MAHHKAIGKPRWAVSQKAEIEKMQKLGLDTLHIGAGKRYDAIIHALPSPIPLNASILDVGCGAACTGKLFNSSNTTYLDPLLDDFKRAFPGELPDGEFINGTIETINRPNNSYDLILCLNTLSFVLNPELALHEIRRLLKRDGTFVISLALWPELLARLHYIRTRIFSVGETQNRLYCYSYQGIINTLERHFDISKEVALDTRAPAFAHEHLFICRHKDAPKHDK
ncbi:MAG TPA: class I SAM-dependent methyltransferase [Mariprofundaceae bacterium]|nr:class I SAM-dependent methyltransferase [Mariprofundaceae bacterium]